MGGVFVGATGRPPTLNHGWPENQAGIIFGKMGGIVNQKKQFIEFVEFVEFIEFME